MSEIEPFGKCFICEHPIYRTEEVRDNGMLKNTHVHPDLQEAATGTVVHMNAPGALKYFTDLDSHPALTEEERDEVIERGVNKGRGTHPAYQNARDRANVVDINEFRKNKKKK
jgi:hypothetical protein